MIQIGDTVVISKSLVQENISGKVGTVVDIVYVNNSQYIGVDFGLNIKGHDCDNRCKWGQGWWVKTADLTVIEDKVVKKKPKPVKYRDVIL